MHAAPGAINVFVMASLPLEQRPVVCPAQGGPLDIAQLPVDYRLTGSRDEARMEAAVV